MANVIGVMGESGSGKTTSLETLDPKTTYIVNSDKKRLPFPKKLREQYSEANKNYYVTDNQAVVLGILKKINEAENPDATVVLCHCMPVTVAEALDPEDVALAQKLLDEAREPIRDQITELTWPWDTVSASVSTILTECLGPELAGPALEPFSSRLALFPARGGDIIGDALLSSLCRVEQEEAPREEPAGGEAEAPSPRAQAD